MLIQLIHTLSKISFIMNKKEENDLARGVQISIRSITEDRTEKKKKEAIQEL